MWQCQKCGKEFKSNNQHHFCEGNKFGTIDEYINSYDGNVKDILRKVRETIKELTPDATEKISWKMPTFWQGENLIHFSAQKNHLGIYPGAIENLSDEIRDRLEGYKTSKGAIQFPYDKPIDYQLISDIVKWRVSVVTE